MANRWWNNEDSGWLYFLGFRITADGDCSHEIKGCLLLGRKVMSNLDSLLKSRDITLPAKVCLVKAMVFPVVMYGCKIWTIKKAEHKNWCFWTVALEKTLASPLDCTEIQPVHPKGNQSWIFIGWSDAEAETLILWPPDVKNWLIGKDPDAGKDWRQEEKETTEEEMAGWHHRLNGHEFEWTPGVGDGQGGLACCSSWGCKESDTSEATELTAWLEKSDWNTVVRLPNSYHCPSASYSYPWVMGAPGAFLLAFELECVYWHVTLCTCLCVQTQYLFSSPNSTPYPARCVCPAGSASLRLLTLQRLQPPSPPAILISDPSSECFLGLQAFLSSHFTFSFRIMWNSIINLQTGKVTRPIFLLVGRITAKLKTAFFVFINRHSASFITLT